MSRGGPSPNEWRLNPTLIQTLWDRFGRAEVDLFASRENAQCALWFSMSARDVPPLGVDVFSHRPWPRVLLYAFSPVPLIPRLLARIQEEGLAVILVAPERTSASWFPTMIQLLSGKPWQLPWRRDALSQLDGSILHFPVIGQRLWVWPLNGSVWKVTTPEQVIHRYRRILKTFRKIRSVVESLKRHGVDKTTFALSSIIAEVTIASEGEEFALPKHAAGTTLQSYAKTLKAFVDGCPDVKKKIEDMKRANRLLPIKNKFRC